MLAYPPRPLNVKTLHLRVYAHELGTMREVSEPRPNPAQLVKHLNHFYQLIQVLQGHCLACLHAVQELDLVTSRELGQVPILRPVVGLASNLNQIERVVLHPKQQVL